MFIPGLDSSKLILSSHRVILTMSSGDFSIILLLQTCIRKELLGHQLTEMFLIMHTLSACVC